MLNITIPSCELWDEYNERFINFKEQSLQLEHSLVSLSKWESRWHKSFTHTKNLTTDEFLDYIRCMTITQNVSADVYTRLSKSNISEIVDYINDSMTATTINQTKKGAPNREIVTSELIYYWMITNNIPFECQKWHLNRLLTLIQICNVKNTKPKPMSKRQLMNRNAALNAARKKQFNTSG